MIASLSNPAILSSKTDGFEKKTCFLLKKKEKTHTGIKVICTFAAMQRVY